MSDLVLSNLTINGRPIGVFDVQPDPPAPTFPSVQIGDQIWMTENLQVNDDGEGIIVVQSVISNGYEFGPQTYYTYDAAVRVANSIEGWHLPSETEFNTLKDYAISLNYTDTRPFRITYGWNRDQGTNELGLSILPIGSIRVRYPDVGEPASVGDECCLRTSTTTQPTLSVVNFMYGNGWSGFTNYIYNWPKDYYLAVRLIKD